MTKTEMANRLLLMTEEKDVDILLAYIDMAEDVILRHLYPFRSDVVSVPDQYQTVWVEVAAYMINKRGAEGESVHLENGISRHYEDGDIPPTLLRKLVPYSGVL